MIVSVTVLGSRDGDATRAVGRVVDYLDGRSPAPAGRSPDWWEDNNLAEKAPTPHHELGVGAGDGAVAYYADSVEGPGTWMGRGLAGFAPSGQVDRDELSRLLSGQDPASGRQLLHGRGSATRAHQLDRVGAQVVPTGPDDELLSMAQAASLLGVSPRYLRKVAVRTAATRHEGDLPEAGQERAPLDHPYLDAAHSGDGGHWQVSRGEVARFAGARKAPSAVIGYDLTFSVAKSVSLLWAQADATRRVDIVAALHVAVAAGVAYLEDNAAFIQSGPGQPQQPAKGLLAASYLHATSRALDPQLHAHVVVANMAERSDGAIRALDGRPLFAHAKTASHLAAAELRTQLTRRLGVEWEPLERGLADIAGVPRVAIAAMSKRSAELEAVLPNLEALYSGAKGAGAKGRQVAAYLTRAAKEEHGVDPEALRPWWANQLEAVSFGPEAARDCYERQAAPALVTEEDRAELFTHLASFQGVTATAATFARRDVLRHVADWSGDRLGAGEVCDLADTWLAGDEVIALAPGVERREGRTGDVIRLGNGRRVSALGSEAFYSTQTMVAVERRLVDAYARGRHAGAAVVARDSLDAVVGERPELGSDQVAMIRSICTSGQTIQCVLGPAGSGKTFALAAAARAWEDAGYTPLGAAVQGTATEVLGDATGMDCSTVASLLARLDRGTQRLNERNVVVVDESSTLGNRDLARLAGYVEHAGAALRLIGDPAQHSAVAAGGGFRMLLERYPEDRAELTLRRRQAGEDMLEVRLAAADYAAGRIGEAVERLRRGDRVVEADNPDQLLDALVADWYVDRLRHQGGPEVAASSIMADHHHERRELNTRARALLAAQGEIFGPVVEVAGQCFQAGDEVLATQQHRDLRAEGARRNDFVRTGERGRVVEARPGPHAVVVVDFERRGRIEVGAENLEARVRPGVVGRLAHAYALTSHMAQGETYHAGRHLSTDASSRAGVYVGLTRGRGDARLYMVRRRDLAPDVDDHVGLPRLEDDTATVEAVTRRLETQRAERLALELDPEVSEVARLVRHRNLAELAAMAGASEDPGADLAARAYRQATADVASAACLAPDAGMVARLGPRPGAGAQRREWDHAVGAVATYRARWQARPVETEVDAGVETGPGAAWALGAPPAGGPALEQYRAVAEALRRAEVSVLAQRPTPELATERRDLQRSLAGAPSPAEHDHALVAVLDARQGVGDAQRRRDEAAERLADLDGPRWRRNRQGIEMARRSLRGAETALAGWSLRLDRAETTQGALEDERPAQEQLRDRLGIVEGALDRQVGAAVAHPAPYLGAALGEPHHSPELDGPWSEAATRIESYRHRELGLIPGDGPVINEDGVVAAIGHRPSDYLDALRWDYVVEELAPELAPRMEPPGIDLW